MYSTLLIESHADPQLRRQERVRYHAARPLAGSGSAGGARWDQDMMKSALQWVSLVVLLVLAAGWSAPAAAQPSDPLGYPLIQTYAPEDYGRRLQSQNWSVTQDSQGVIYVANPGGVLAYDSATWRLIPTDQQTLVRTVVTGPEGTVYAGAYGEIGALRPDSTGALQYESLLDALPSDQRSFGHTWSGVATSEGVYFQTRQHLFHWDGAAMQTWTASDSTAFRKIFAVRDTVYVDESGEGLRQLVDGTLTTLVPERELGSQQIYSVMPHAEGLLIGTDTDGLYRYAGGEVTRFGAQATAFLRQNEHYDGLALPNGTYALATLRGGVLIMDAQGQTRRVLNREIGLISNDIKSLFLDRQGGLWMACEAGIARAEVQAPVDLYDERAGLDGVGLVLQRHDGAMHVGTSAGIFRLARETAPDGTVRPVFEPVAQLRAQIFDMVSAGPSLLAATSKGVFTIRNGGATSIVSGRTAFALHASRRSDEMIYVGYIDGAGSLRREGGTWTADGELADFNDEVRFIAEEAGGALWLASAYGGLWRIDQPGDLSGNPRIAEMDSEDQTPRHTYRFARGPDGLHIITRQGLARPVVEETEQVTLAPDSTTLRAIPSDARIVDVQVAPDGEYWVFTDQGLIRVRAPGRDGAVEMPLAGVEDFSAFATRAEAGGTFWVTGEEGVLRHQPRAFEPPEVPVHTLIRKVSLIKADSVLFDGGASRAGRTPELAPSADAVRFAFAAPAFGNESANEYRFRLIQYNPEWSDWTTETKKDYTNLGPGHYTFEVQARNPGVWEGRTAQFTFVKLPPWYRTTWAYLLYIILGAAALSGIVWWRSAHLQARARRLEQLVDERTAEVQEQAEQLELYNRALQQSNRELNEALEEKSELLGVAAHDLKNPLFGIRGLAEVLLDDADLDESDHRKIKLIHESADETLTLINNLLDSAAASSGQVNLDLQPLDLCEVAQWVVRRFEPQAERKDQELSFSATEADCTVNADEEKLRESMSNLVSNAVKYAPLESTIEVEVRRVNGEVQFLVHDEGPGLSPQEQENLFAPFQRLSPEPTGGESSSGLGLYIVKQLVDLQDGRVAVESEKGEGSTFMFALPHAGHSHARAHNGQMD